MTTTTRIAFPSASGLTDTTELLALPFPVPALLTTRHAGEMGASGGSMTDARRRMLQRLRIPEDQFVSLHQIHSRRVHRVFDRSGAYGCDGDGMVGDASKFVFGITVADCMPIFLHDRRHGVSALLHSGWRGTGIAGVALDCMREEHESRPEDIDALLGPAIGACCYNVDAARARAFASEWGNDSVRRADGANYLDLRAANIGILSKAGVASIAYVDACTSCETALSSFRRQGPEEYTGMLALMGGTPAVDSLHSLRLLDASMTARGRERK